MRALLVICLLSRASWACPRGTKSITTKDSKTVSQGCATPKGVFHGPFVIKDHKGRLVLEGKFYYGDADGQWAVYENGVLRTRPLYDRGVLISDDSATQEESDHQQEVQ